MSELLDLFDELCELPHADRERRLRDLENQDAALGGRLRAMLAADQCSNAVMNREIDQQAVLGAAWTAPLAHDRSGQRFGSYEVLRELGAGGMGSVWLARRMLGESTQQVAIKFMHRRLGSGVLRHFQAERDALARLEHPGIARLIDAGVTAEGEPYIATEYVEGTGLLEHVRTQQLDLSARLLLLEQLCDAVDYAHRRLLVHRDIKPSNVLVDRAGKVRLLDFGIVKSLEAGGPAATQDNPLSPAYAAPEQLLGLPISTAVDVHALGLLLYEMLTGGLPHWRRGRQVQLQRGNGDQVNEAPSQSAVPEVAQLDRMVAQRDWLRRLRGDLDQIALKACHPVPERRYASAAALADDLRRYREGRPILARPDSTRYRLRKLLARNPWTSLLGAASLLSVMLLSLWAFASMLRAEAASARALRAQSFLLSTFTSADTTQVRGEKITAAEILASASERVEREFTDDPMQRSELRLALARIYYNAGNAQKVRQLTSTIIAEALHEPRLSAGLVARAQLQRGIAFAALKEAAPAYADALAAATTFRSLNSTYQLDLAEALVLLGTTFADRQNNVAVLEPINEAIDILHRELGAQHEKWADALIGRATAHEDLGQFEQARRDYQTGVPVLAASLGDVHPKTAIARLAYAGLLDRLGETAAAREAFELGITATRQLYDNRGRRLINALFSRGIFFQSIAAFAEAERDFREALALDDATPELIAHLHRYLGMALSSQGRLSEALESLQLAVQHYQSSSGTAEAQYWRARADVGSVLHEQGDHPQAKLLLQEAVDQITQLIGAERYELIRPLQNLAQVHLSLGERAEAAACLERGLRIATAQLGPEHPKSCLMQAGLAEIQHASAAPLRSNLRQSLLSCQQALARTHPNSVEAARVQAVLAEQ